MRAATGTQTMSNIDRGGFDQAEYDRRFHSDFMYDATLEDDDQGSGRSPLFVVLTGLVLAAFGAVVWVAYQQGVKQGDRGAPPVIVAEQGPIKVAPDNPGGVVVPDQDKLIYERIASAGPEETPDASLAPPPETPRDLPAPQRDVAEAPAAAEAPESPGAAEAGEAALAEAEAETAQPTAEQVAAEQQAREQAAALTAEIEKIDPGAAEAAERQQAVASGAFVVQLGAFKQDVDAAQRWETLKNKNNDQLGDRRPDIKRVDLGEKGVWYRLRVGPFETRADAVAMCEVLRTRGTDCLVAKP